MFTKEELKKLEIKKLAEEAYKAAKELFQVKFKLKTGQEKNSAKLEILKRYVARAKTIQRSKEIEEKTN